MMNSQRGVEILEPEQSYYDLLDGFSQKQTQAELVSSLRDYFKIDRTKAFEILTDWEKMENIRLAQRKAEIRQRLFSLVRMH